jgi:hypothetical protein
MYDYLNPKAGDFHPTLPQKSDMIYDWTLLKSDVTQHEKRTIVQTSPMTGSAAMGQASVIDL